MGLKNYISYIIFITLLIIAFIYLYWFDNLDKHDNSNINELDNKIIDNETDMEIYNKMENKEIANNNYSKNKRNINMVSPIESNISYGGSKFVNLD